MSVQFEELTKELEKAIKDYSWQSDVKNAGRIVACNDGVITIKGLMDVKSNELLYLGNGQFALALNLEENQIGAIVLTSGTIVAGAPAYSTGKIISVPVGKQLLGRVINALGEPLDNEGPIICKEFRTIESPAPLIVDREKVNEPLQTGLKAIDSMVPIGKGQRELIIGDRQTGKTTIAIDTILNQKGKNVICVYVAIGQKASTVSRVINTLRDHGALPYTIVVAATAGDSAPLQYIAPYTGTAIAEFFMYSKNKDVLIVYDDLTKHAVAYRTISLLLKRPSGREAYPGDIFYVHSRLLERSAHLSKKLGGGSLTALPIIETLGGDISAYIPTNVISITDGQIYLEKELFNAGVRPAINVGLSVSRVGGSAQVKAMRKVAGQTRLDLAHYREMVVFARFGTDIDAATKKVINKGERLTEVMKQTNNSPKPLEEMVIALYVATEDLLEDIEVKNINKFVDDFVEYLKVHNRKLVNKIAVEKTLDKDEDGDVIKKALGEFKASL